MGDEDFDSLAIERRIDARCDEFQRALASGQSPRIENFLADATPLMYLRLLTELLGLEIDYRFAQNQQPALHDYAHRFPSLSSEQIAAIIESSQAYQSQLRTSHFRRVVLRGCGALFAIGERSN